VSPSATKLKRSANTPLDTSSAAIAAILRNREQVQGIFCIIVRNSSSSDSGALRFYDKSAAL
jgi:hypothetical protein